jgi:hypothetical protein
MNERRFSDDEVAAIFAKATDVKTTTSQRHLPSNDGLTLAELQEIGREVGIAPDRVAQAAASIEQVGTATSRRFLGLPLGVGRTVELDRRLSDEEWDQLVVDLRETFDARGTVRQEGSFRQWTNGNLQALLEPTPTGHRIRLRTINAGMRAWMMGGLGMLGIATATSVAAVLGGAGAGGVASVAELGVIGAGMFAFGALRVPGWARRRQKQMEAIAEKVARPSMLPAGQAAGDDHRHPDG